MTCPKIAHTLVAAMVLLTCGIHPVAGDVISQLPGKDYLVVEAEDVDSIDDPLVTEAFLIVTADDPIVSPIGSLVLPEDTNASGGAALYVQPGASTFENVALWKLQFAKAGEYTLYYHYSLYEGDPPGPGGGYGNEDSFFLASDFNQEPEQPAGRSNLGTQGHNDPSETPPFWEGQFHWQVATLQNGRPARYVVSDNELGNVLEFSLAVRERGSTLDLMVFHPDGRLMQGRTEEELDAMFLGGADLVPLQAGDADQDLDFDQLDLVQVLVAAKYLTGQAATWGEGDWNGAPGGSPGNPPTGDSLFNQMDIIAAQQAGYYLTGAYAAINPHDVLRDLTVVGSLAGASNQGELGLLYVPEPATVIPAVMGLAGLLMLRWRRRID